MCYVIYVNDAKERSCVLCDICERRKWVILYVMWYMWTTQVSDLVCYVIYVNDATEWSCVLCDICERRKWAILRVRGVDCGHVCSIIRLYFGIVPVVLCFFFLYIFFIACLRQWLINLVVEVAYYIGPVLSRVPH